MSKHAYRPSRLGHWLLRTLGSLPLWLAAALGSVFGECACVFDWRRRYIVRRNLELCFPDMNKRERHRLMRRHFRALSRSALCSLALAWSVSEQRLIEVVRFRGRHHYLDALAQGRGVILLAPHFVNLEIGWLRLAHERPMVTMYREPRAHLVHWAAHRQRLRFGGHAIERRAHLKPLIARMREGCPFYYLPDTDPGKKVSHVFAPFFGVPAATVTALSRLARMTRALVIPCVTRERRWGRYEIEFQAPLADFPGTDEDVDATRMNAFIEHVVRRIPEQYLWIHRRFKTRPGRTPKLYDCR